MELTGLLLAAIGAADLVRRRVPARGPRAAGVAAVLLLCAAAGALLGADPVSSAVLATAPPIAALCWLAAMRQGRPTPARRERGARGLLAVSALGVAALVPFFASPATDDVAVGRLGGLSSSLLVLAAGGGLFLLESANVVVRTALRAEDVPVEPPPRRQRPFAPRTRTPVEPPSPAVANTLRGGRIIGPLERVVLAGLVLAQAYPVVAALIAAKGIVRFPEISRDRDRGTQAEYFLVGSMVSWALSLAVAGLIALGAASA